MIVLVWVMRLYHSIHGEITVLVRSVVTPRTSDRAKTMMMALIGLPLKRIIAGALDLPWRRHYVYAKDSCVMYFVGYGYRKR